MTQEDRTLAQNKKKKNWFETLCTMDETDVPSKKKKGTTAKNSGRTRVSNRAAGPYGDDIPPFDDTASEPIGDHIFDDVEETPKKKPTTRSTSSSSSSKRAGPSSGGRTTSQRSSSSKSSSSSRTTSRGSSSKSGKRNDKPLPADIAYRMQPYVVLFVGALLAIMLLLSAIMGGDGADTHPFRWVGYHVERLLFGLLGYGAFLLPLMMVYLSVRCIRDGKDEQSGGLTALATGIVVLLPAVIHACMIEAGRADGALNTLSLKQLYLLGADKQGGGVVAGLLGTLLERGLGVIATLIIGIVLLLVAAALLFGITPAKIKFWWCAWSEARQERLDREAYEREQAEKEQRRLAASTGRRKQALPQDEDDDDTMMLLPGPSRARSQRENERRRAEALREAERSDKREGRRGTSASDDEAETYLDPMSALLSGDKRRTKKEKEEEIAPTPETVFPDEDHAVSSPIEYVSELTSEEIEEMERSYAQSHAPVASVVPPEYEPEEEEEREPFVAYPARVEIEVDDATAPTEGMAPEQTEDYQGGFDYSMESSQEAETDADVETIGGVDVKIQKLSDEERERGEKIAAPEEEEYTPRPYTYPRVDLLNEPKPHNALKDQEIRAKMQKLSATLTNFKVRIEGISYVCGPAVTRYEVRPAPGVRVRSIANLADDIAMSLAANSIRIEAPIPGKEAVGIEVPNTTRETVFLRRLIDSNEFRSRPSKLTACLGEDVAGNPILFDIVKMPHLLVAGTTGSGKSVCINDFIMSLVYKSTPQEVKIILIDPKQVEFTVYKDMPHLMAPIVCDPKRAAAVLNLAVLEMEKRFQMIRDVQARNIEGYNAATENDRYEHPYMPHIVIIIDELADLMMQAKDEVENSIVRLAQKARAAGMHLIIGTQRPSVDVITGLIKANVPSRIACTVVSQVDSRTILDVAGAEKLLGMGDMLYAPVGSPKPLRVQGAFVSDGEVERIVEFIKRNNDPVRYDQEFMDNIDREAAMIGTKRQPGGDDDDEGESPDGMDPKFYDALRIALDNKRISTSLLQRMLSIGYGRAAKIIDQMERMGFVGPAVGNKPREIRITEQGYAELIMNKDQ
ncbi:MAG: DNA translocase FtsK [Ruminococcaceae bacterium]|nr:DNA translocase FtsK [Oscillospiraceae bacterium]